MTAQKTTLKAAATGQAANPHEEDTSYAGFKHKMELSKHQFLPLFGNSTANVDAFLTVVYNAVSFNPDLLACDRRSLFLACMDAAKDGLLPDRKEAVFNVYSTKVSRRGEPDKWIQMVQYLPMVKGSIKILRRIPGVRTVDACAVYKGEPFKYQRGDDPRIEHEPRGDGTADDITAAYVIVGYQDGTKEREVMFRRDIEKARGASKSPNGGAWRDWFDQMAIKSVIHRIHKRMPSTPEVDAAMANDLRTSGWDTATGPAQGAVDMMTPAAGAPALTDQSGQGMTFDTQGREEEKVPVAKATKAAKKADQAPTSEPEKINREPAGVMLDDSGEVILTFSDVLAQIKASKDRDMAMEAMDLARHLAPAEQVELQAAFASRFPDHK